MDSPQMVSQSNMFRRKRTNVKNKEKHYFYCWVKLLFCFVSGQETTPTAFVFESFESTKFYTVLDSVDKNDSWAVFLATSSSNIVKNQSTMETFIPNII